MKCSTCDKQIDGVEIFGNFGDEKCFTCWMDSEAVADTPEADERVRNLASRDVEKIKTTVDCNWCRGTGKRSDGNKDCWKCKGVGKLIGQICGTCNGFGEVDHECECNICTEDMERCGDCENGVEYVAFIPKNTPTAIDVKTYWLQAA